MAHMQPNRRALIVGGGIGGLAAAVALRRIGIEPVVFERAPEIREVGAGLGLWSNAVQALRRLGLAEQVGRRGSVLTQVRTTDSRGALLEETDIGAISKKAGAPSLCVHRADLQRVLAESAGAAAIRTGAVCAGVEQHGDRVAVRFADGTMEEGDLLVGADGIHSAVRAALFGEAQPRYAGYTCWRGMARFEAPQLPSGLALFGVGSGCQAGLFPCGARSVYWFVTRNAPAGGADPAGAARGAVLETLSGWSGPLPRAVEATEEQAIFRNDIIDRPPTRRWGVGRVTLLGDAVHATTPNLGQGACMALEDAVFLAHSLEGASGIEAGLRHYEERRRERTAWVTEQSHMAGRMLQLENRAGIWLRNSLIRVPGLHGVSVKMLERLLGYELPDLTTTETR